jgi:hypothetical protein
MELTDNTVVSFVVGSRAGLDLLSTFRRSAPDARVAAVTVKPSDPTVVPTMGEDGSGVVDLPVRRVAAYVAIGIAVFGLIGLRIATLSSDSGVTIGIAGIFAAIIGGIIGAIVGGSRLAGERANSQPRAPGRSITVVAAFLEDDATAASLARSVGPAADYEVRILDHDGGWRSPGAGSAAV